MFKVIGFIMLFATLLGGFVLSKGRLGLLWHPTELLTLFGPVLSCFLIANPWSVVKDTGSQLSGVFGDEYTMDFYKDSLLLMFDLTKLYKEKGNVELENHIDNPKDSEIFIKYPRILKQMRSVNFISENLRLVTNGKFSPHDIESYIDSEIEAFIAEHSLPSKALDQVTEMLPSLGIVVAVAGIIITMQYINGSAAEFGEHISAALFGTFCGVFSAYAIVSPISKALQNKTEKFKHYLEVLKSNIISIVHGYSPFVAIEIARKNIPPGLRVSPSQIEAALRGESSEVKGTPA
jgi:chemotaxis protein MotA